MRPTTQAQTFLVAGGMTSAGGYKGSDGKTESTVFHSSSMSQFIPPVLQAFVRHIFMDTSVTSVLTVRDLPTLGHYGTQNTHTCVR